MMLVMDAIFFSAYFNPSKTLLIGVDYIEGSNIEVGAILIMTGLALAGLYIACQRIKRDLKFLEFWGVTFPMAMMIFLVAEFLLTYHYYSSRMMLFTVDYFHEADLELIVVPVSTLLAILGQAKIVLNLKK
jgi:tellurite resistance protein TehA-like permease